MTTTAKKFGSEFIDTLDGCQFSYGCYMSSLTITPPEGMKIGLDIGDIMRVAPELLAALERIVAINGCTSGKDALIAEFKHIARTAIAKVGEPKATCPIHGAIAEENFCPRC